MPSVSKKQRNFMAAAAHDPAFAKRVGISQKVAKEFNQADKGKKFRGGGMAKCKKYEEGGLTFADMSEEDRSAMAKARIAEMGGPMPETPKRRVAKVNAGDTRENLRDLDAQGADTGYDTSEKARMAKQTGSRHFAGRPSASAEPQTFTPSKTGAAKYSEAKSGSGGPSREIKPAKKGAVEDLVDTFRRGPRLLKSGGAVKKMASGGTVRGCGCAIKGKTRGRMV